MSWINWLNDHDLETAVKGLLKTAILAKKNAVNNFGKNVIDPFSAIFEMAGFEMTFEEWQKSEEARQAQKTLSNGLGAFHQAILGSCPGWVDLKTGSIFDLVNNQQKIIAEVKNKHNTVTKGKLGSLFKTLESAVMDKTSVYKSFTVYYVTIVPLTAARFNRTFTPSDPSTGSRYNSNNLVREIDGASFYELVTGYRDALEELYTCLPSVIAHITKRNSLDQRKLKLLFKGAYG